LTDKQKEEVKAILHNQDTPVGQIHQQLKDWVAKQDEATQKAFAEAMAKKEEMKKRREGRRAEMLKNASQEAKTLSEQIAAIHNNEELSRKQQCEQANELLKAASDAVRAELHMEVRDCSKPFHMGMGHKGGHPNRHV
jgi:acyl-CoA reductase-like NAD-dependent aldehyde dehydrogenase